MGGHVGQLELQRLEFRQAAVELAALVHVAPGRVQRALGRADRAGADVDATAVQAFMAILKPSPSLPSRLAAGTRTFSNTMGRVDWLFQPIFSSLRP